MSASNSFVVGQCTRAHDFVFMRARAQSIDGTMRDLTHTSQNEFPPDGEIELRGARAILKQDDWAIARPVLDGPPRRQRWVSQTARKLLPFEDLSGLSSPEVVRRLLVETGLQESCLGEKVFRIGTEQMVVVTMVRSEDGRYRATSADMGRLLIYQFDPAQILVIPTPGGSVSLMEKQHQSAEIGVTNWVSDAQYVEQVVRAALSNEDADQKAVAAIAATLLAHAGKLAGQLSNGGKPDPKVVQEILRSRRLGDLLVSRPALIADFMTALRRDPDIAARVEQEITRLATETVEAKKTELAAQLTTSLEAELAAVRQERMSKLEAELSDLEVSSLQELQEKIDSQKSSALSAIEVRKVGLERAVSELERARDGLHESHRLKVQEIETLTADVGRLTSEIVDRKADIDRLLRMEEVLKGSGDRSREADEGPFFPLARPEPSSRPLLIGEIQDWLKASQLLTEAGRRGTARLATLILSGGVPVIDGPEADDVCDILSAMLAGSAMTAFDCDPTVISYDDLWCRPGSGATTALGLALADVQSTAAVRLCVVRRAELSPSRFWLDTLRRASKRRSFPNAFLLCVAGAGEDEEEDRKDPSAFRAEGWIERGAAGHALASLVDEAFPRVADISELPFDPAVALTMMGAAPLRLSISDARWLAQLVPMAKTILKGDAGPYLKDILEALAGDVKPALKLIDNGGPSRA
jgi:hypothetical protein